MPKTPKPAVSSHPIDHHIRVIRGQKVMLDSGLAALYGVETKMVNRAVRRNPERFPERFMFQLTQEEAQSLRFQSGTSNGARNLLRFRWDKVPDKGTVFPSDAGAKRDLCP
jgi:hypothetical protein